MDEVEAGKAAFLKLIAEIDSAIGVVIPSRATDDRFLIALTRNGKRVFVTISEDDLIDLETDADVRADVLGKVREALGKI